MHVLFWEHIPSLMQSLATSGAECGPRTGQAGLRPPAASVGRGGCLFPPLIPGTQESSNVPPPPFTYGTHLRSGVLVLWLTCWLPESGALPSSRDRRSQELETDGLRS